MDSRYYLIFILACIGIIQINAQATLEQSQNSTTISDDLLIEDDEIFYQYPNVLSVRFHLRHTLIPDLLTRISLLEMQCPIKECNISLADIAQAIQLDGFNNTDIADAIDKMNITGSEAYNMLLIYNINPTVIENFLSKLGTTFSEIYKTIVDSLYDPQNTIPKILAAVNVSALDFTNAQAYGNDTTKLQVLATGNYSYENIQAALNISNKTCLDILKALPLNTIGNSLQKFDDQEFRNFLKNLGITSSKLLAFYNYLNITSTNFVAYPGYISLLTDFEISLNPEEVLATVTSNTTLVTSNKAKSLITFQTDNTEFVKNYSYFQVENIQNPLTHYHIISVLLKNDEYKSDDVAFIEVRNVYKDNITQLVAVQNSSSLGNCTYVTKLPFGEIHVENFTVLENPNGHLITLNKTNTTVYNLGSPLFCQNKLVAMATQDSPNEIQFSTFAKKSNETSKPASPSPIPSPGSNATTSKPGSVEPPNAASANFGSYVCVILFTSIIVFFD